MKHFTFIFLDHLLGDKIIVTLKSVKKFIGNMSSFIKSSFLWESELGGIFHRGADFGPALCKS